MGGVDRIEILNIEKVVSIWYRCDVCGSEDFVVFDTADYYAGSIGKVQCDFCLSRYELNNQEESKVLNKFEGMVE